MSAVELTFVTLVGPAHHQLVNSQITWPAWCHGILLNLSGQNLLLPTQIMANTSVLKPPLDAPWFDSHLNQVTDFATARNYALSQVQTEWVIFLDADEQIDPEGWTQIRQLIKQNNFVGFYLYRHDIFAGQELKYGETGQIRLLRLFQTKLGKWQNKVHEIVKVNGSTQTAEVIIKHYAHENIADFIRQIANFSRLMGVSIKYNQWTTLAQLLVFPLAKLGQNLVLRSAWRDGWRGVVYVYAMSLHSTCVRVFTYENRPQPYH